MWQYLFDITREVYFREILGGGFAIGFLLGFIVGRVRRRRRRRAPRGIVLEATDRIVSVRELEILQRKAEVAADAADSAKEHGEEMERRIRILLSPVKTSSVERRRR